MTAAYDQATALVVVDVQNDFADPDGGLYVPGGEEVVAIVNDEITNAREAGATIVYTQDWHPPSTPHFEKDGGVWPVHCVRDTWGAQLHPDLEVVGEVVRKGVDGGDGYSGFAVRDPVSGEESRTDLQRLLEAARVRRLVVTGLAGDVCVTATAVDGAHLGYDVEVPLATTRMVELTEGDAEAAIARMQDSGVRVIPA